MCRLSQQRSCEVIVIILHTFTYLRVILHIYGYIIISRPTFSTFLLSKQSINQSILYFSVEQNVNEYNDCKKNNKYKKVKIERVCLRCYIRKASVQ